MKSRACLAAAALVACGNAAAAPIAMNEAAIARGFALPALGDGPLPDRGRLTQQFDLDFINEFFLGNSSRDSLETDGEAERLAWRGRYGIAPRWEVGLTVPFYFTSGGFLDSTIESWHHFFGLPNANRADRPDRQIVYRYTRDGVTLLDVHDSAEGIGDLRLQAGYAASDLIVIRTQLKLPTGSSSHLLGNGAVGGATWVDFTMPFPAGSRFSGFASAGLSYNATGDVLAPLQRHVIPFGAVGLSCRLFGELSAAVQYAIHGKLYENSTLAPLDSIGAPLSFGLDYRFTNQMRLEALIQEDSSVYASPDFVLHFALTVP